MYPKAATEILDEMEIAVTEEIVVVIVVIRAEKRPPSINLVKRVPNVLKNLAKLTYIIRIKG